MFSPVPSCVFNQFADFVLIICDVDNDYVGEEPLSDYREFVTDSSSLKNQVQLEAELILCEYFRDEIYSPSSKSYLYGITKNGSRILLARLS